jgi:hypothetical protein
MLGKLLDRFCFDTIFLFVAVLVILGGNIFSLESKRPDMKSEKNGMVQSAPFLPREVGMWTGPYSPQIVTGKNIFDYMDGAGELYLGYRFDHLDVYEYHSPAGEDILVELYFMRSADDAFGLLSLDWSGEPWDLNHPSQDGVYDRKKEFDGSRWPRALYGEGLLRLRVGEIYARVMATRETPESRQAVLSIGGSIAKSRAESAPPSILEDIPRSFLPGWDILRKRTAYLRSHLVLNSVFYLSHENILDLDIDCEAVAASYQKQDTAGSSSRFQYLLVKYPDRERAKKALIRFRMAYLPEYPLAEFPPSSETRVEILAVEDGWLAYRLCDRSLVLIFECPDRQTAGNIIDQIK